MLIRKKCLHSKSPAQQAPLLLPGSSTRNQDGKLPEKKKKKITKIGRALFFFFTIFLFYLADCWFSVLHMKGGASDHHCSSVGPRTAGAWFPTTTISERPHLRNSTTSSEFLTITDALINMLPGLCAYRLTSSTSPLRLYPNPRNALTPVRPSSPCHLARCSRAP